MTKTKIYKTATNEMQIIPTETEKNKAIYEIVTEICITQQATGRGSLMLRFCKI